MHARSWCAEMLRNSNYMRAANLVELAKASRYMGSKAFDLAIGVFKVRTKALRQRRQRLAALALVGPPAYALKASCAPWLGNLVSDPHGRYTLWMCGGSLTDADVWEGKRRAQRHAYIHSQTQARVSLSLYMYGLSAPRRRLAGV